MNHKDPLLQGSQDQPGGHIGQFKRLNSSKWSTAAAAGGIFVLMLALNIMTPYICDDFTYDLHFGTGQRLTSFWEIFPSMYAHSFSMNGRLMAHGLAQVFMLLPPIVFDIVNAAVFTGTLVFVLRLCSRERNALLLISLFCLIWLWMPVFGQVVLWQVGALNYFWSLTALVLYIAPALFLFTENREILKTRRHCAGFCLYGLFFGWYSETASFVGICMVLSLTVLDCWMNRRRFCWHRLLPILTAGIGYIAMLTMPAQTANKQGAALTFEVLILRFGVCCKMLVQYLALPLALFAILFALGRLLHLPGKTLVLAGLFALAGVCANFMPLAASYYPERCLCTSVLMLLMASLFLAAPLSTHKRLSVLITATCLILVLTLPAGVRGCRDIASCCRQHTNREATIAAQLAQGNRDVIANAVVPETAWSGFWGIRELTDDPKTWPNHAMSIFYGLDSLVCE